MTTYRSGAADYRAIGRMKRKLGHPKPPHANAVPGQEIDRCNEAIVQGWLDEDAYIRAHSKDQHVTKRKPK